VTRISAFGITANVPDHWESRIFRHEGGEPTLHAATFALPPSDGEFGSRATGRMPIGGLFLSLTEYRTGDGLEVTGGLFGEPPPRTLADEHFSSRALLQARPGQRGLQRFFSDAGRAFCLYVVVADTGLSRHRVEALAHFLASLDIRPKAV
jgi:hypothetical protein